MKFYKNAQFQLGPPFRQDQYLPLIFVSLKIDDPPPISATPPPPPPSVLYDQSLIVNQEWKNGHFNAITENEGLAVEIELQNGDRVILATIYFPNGNPSLRLFRMSNALSNQVIFLRDFNSKDK